MSGLPEWDYDNPDFTPFEEEEVEEDIEEVPYEELLEEDIEEDL